VSDAQALPTGHGIPRRVLATLLDVVRSRCELAAIDLEEERLRLADLWLAAACTLFAAFVTVVLLAAWIVLMCPPADRPLALGLLVLAFGAAGAAFARRWHKLGSAKPLLLAATVDELRKDADQLREGLAK
jgi:uncharacterized membrane protein YqjE